MGRNGSEDALSSSDKTLLLCLFLSSLGASQAIPPPSLFQPQPSVDNGQGNPQILCQVQGSPASAHVLSWYQQLPGEGPTFLLSQREGATPIYGPGVTPRFLAHLDSEKNSVQLTVGNASPEDVGIYYCALWHAGKYIFGEGTWLLYQAQRVPLGPHPPQLTLLTSGPGSPILCMARGHQPAPLRLSWILESQLQDGAAEEIHVENMGDAVVSTLHLSNRSLGGTITCKADHESGTSVATLRLPPSKEQAECFMDAETWNGGQEKDPHLLAWQQQTLTLVLYCYVGLLGGANLCALLLVALLAASPKTPCSLCWFPHSPEAQGRARFPDPFKLKAYFWSDFTHRSDLVLSPRFTFAYSLSSPPFYLPFQAQKKEAL